jgi:chloramphenicol 3-O phosphotransferase
VTDLLDLTPGVDVLLVHVTCDPVELDRREAGRGDRDPGTARAQAGVVFAHGEADLTVDTTHGVEAAAADVVALIERPPDERAFDKLRARRDADG